MIPDKAREICRCGHRGEEHSFRIACVTCWGSDDTQCDGWNPADATPDDEAAAVESWDAFKAQHPEATFTPQHDFGYFYGFLAGRVSGRAECSVCAEWETQYDAAMEHIARLNRGRADAAAQALTDAADDIESQGDDFSDISASLAEWLRARAAQYREKGTPQ